MWVVRRTSGLYGEKEREEGVGEERGGMGIVGGLRSKCRFGPRW